MSGAKVRREELECPDPDMARCDPRQDRSWLEALTLDLLPGQSDCQRSCRRDPHGCHRF